MSAAPWRSHGALRVLGTGHALPGPVVTNAALLAQIETRFGLTRGRQAETVARRMGIASRHLGRAFEAREEAPRAGESNPDLAAGAVRAALAQAGVDIDEIGYLIGHTATPAQPLPANIALVADRLGYAGPHVELRQACTGFANALMIAFGLLARADAAPVVIVGSETGSQFFDPLAADSDSGQCVNMMQMGDGAAAIVLGPAQGGGATITAAWFGAAGLGRAPGIQRRSREHFFRHDFAVIRATGTGLFDAGAAAARSHGVDLAEVERIIPHQVGGAIGAHLAAHFALPEARFFVHADRVGNTGSAAIWLALDALRCARPAPGARALVLGAEASKFLHGGFVYTHG